MLEGLDRIDWSQHKHAFGPADNVPSLLRSVAAGGRTANEAVNELFNTIWHQGTVYAATEMAVPFLGQMARSNDLDVETREAVLALIYSIGRGKGYLEVHANSSALRTKQPDDPLPETEKELVWVQGCKRAVGLVADALLDELDSLPTRLWPAAAVLTIVAGESGRSFVHEIASESTRRLPAFGSAGLATLAEFVANGSATPQSIQHLCEIDDDLADFVMQQKESNELDLSLDSYLVDVLTERICDTSVAAEPDLGSPPADH